MITNQQINIINFLVVCTSDFARRHKMDASSAYHFLSIHGGISFLIHHYDIEHTLSLDDTLDDLELVCHQNGGVLQ